MDDADKERLAALKQGASGAKPEGYVYVSTTDLRWLLQLAERNIFQQARRPREQSE